MKKKKWFKKNMTTKVIREIIDFTKELEKEYGITIDFIDDNAPYAAWYGSTREIELVIKETPQRMLSQLFHELGHCYCYDIGLYRAYHHRSGIDGYKVAIRYGLKAEKFVDGIGKKLMKTYFPDIPYLKGYSKDGIAFWKKIWVPYLRSCLDSK